MKTYFEELAAYNSWANGLICDWLSKISDEQWNRPLKSSFPSVRDTVIHLVGAENAWWQRLRKDQQIVWIPNTFQGTKAEALELWRESFSHLEEFVKELSATQLSENLDFKRLNGEANRMKISEVLAHVFNHSTYHRGQLVTLLRQVGFTDVSSTDLLNFYRSKPLN